MMKDRWRNRKMTIEEVEKMIWVSAKGNDYGDFRANYHLNLVLLMMYECHIKPVYIYRLKMEDIEVSLNGTIIGSYVTKKGGYHEFDIPKDVWFRLKKYVEKYKIPPTEPLIQVKERNIRDVFKRITEYYGIEARLIDVYYTGLLK